MPTLIAIAVVERDGCYLVGLRPQGKPLAGYWEFPGGKVLAGETAAAAAARECLEETGLTVEVLAEYAPAEHDYAHDHVELRFFRCRLRASLEQPRGGWRWVTAAEMSELEFPAANAALVKSLDDRNATDGA